MHDNKAITLEDVMALTLPALAEQYTIPETMCAAVLFGPRDLRVIEIGRAHV